MFCHPILNHQYEKRISKETSIMRNYDTNNAMKDVSIKDCWQNAAELPANIIDVIVVNKMSSSYDSIVWNLPFTIFI